MFVYRPFAHITGMMASFCLTVDAQYEGKNSLLITRHLALFLTGLSVHHAGHVSSCPFTITSQIHPLVIPQSWVHLSPSTSSWDSGPL